MVLDLQNVEINLPYGFTACESPHIPEYAGLIFIYTSDGLNVALPRETPSSPVAVIHVESRQIEPIDTRGYVRLISGWFTEALNLQVYKETEDV